MSEDIKNEELEAMSEEEEQEIIVFPHEDGTEEKSCLNFKIKNKNLEDKKMKEFKYVVTDNEGIHARPAGELVKLVKGFESKITIEKDGKIVECRKLLALMGLGVKKGHEVTFTFDGADEDAAYEAVSKFMQENL